jgi:hypothetical protein
MNQKQPQCYPLDPDVYLAALYVEMYICTLKMEAAGAFETLVPAIPHVC